MDVVTTPAAKTDERTRLLLVAVRQALIITLNAIEDYLGVPRSVVTARRRQQKEYLQ